MSLSLAPPPGLPLSTLDTSAIEALVQQYTLPDTSYLIPLICFVVLAFYGLTQALKWFFPPKKVPASWEEEFIDPYIGTSSASLTTTEIVTKIFRKDPHLAESVEPLLHEMDLVKFSDKKEKLEPIINKTRSLFAATMKS